MCHAAHMRFCFTFYSFFFCYSFSCTMYDNDDDDHGNTDIVLTVFYFIHSISFFSTLVSEFLLLVSLLRYITVHYISNMLVWRMDAGNNNHHRCRLFFLLLPLLCSLLPSFFCVRLVESILHLLFVLVLVLSIPQQSSIFITTTLPTTTIRLFACRLIFFPSLQFDSLLSTLSHTYIPSLCT